MNMLTGKNATRNAQAEKYFEIIIDSFNNNAFSQ